MSQTVQRATEIIELIAAEPRTPGGIAAHFGLHRSTIFRQLQTLERAGFLLHRADGTYTIGARIVSIAQQVLDNLDLRQIAFEEIRSLHQNVGNTIHLAQLLEDSVVYVDKVDGGGSVHMYSRIGRQAQPHCSGVGKIVLAQLPLNRRDALLRDTDWTPHTATTHVSRESLDVELDEIRRNGWGVDNCEFEDFINCVAAPVSNSTGTIVGAVSITSIKMIKDLDELKDDLDLLLSTTRAISSQLG